MQRWTMVAFGAVALARCAPPPPPPPTVLTLTLNAARDANPTAEGQGAPVAVRVYQLGPTGAFEGAEFFRLYNDPTGTLGTDLIRKDEFLMAPGSIRTLTLQPADTVTAIGVFAAVRDFQHETYRVTLPVAPHRTTAASVAIGRAGVALTQ